MRTEKPMETSVLYVQLTQLIAREDLIEFSRHESCCSNIYAYNCFLSVGFSVPVIQISHHALQAPENDHPADDTL